jgi:threonylcarbamoyladenosine tRNA methylthiotransferase MtaB
MPTVALKTLGCKLNQYETEEIRSALEAAGFEAVPFESPADVYVVNTCTVTGQSDYKSRQLVRRVCRTRPEARVVVTGCYADLHPSVFAALGPNVAVVSNREKGSIAALFGGDAISPAVTRFAERTRVFLKIQDGCGHACAYCIVVKARGPSRSRPQAEIVAHVRAIVAEGVKEVVLTGVDLGSYGRDLDEGADLASLVAALEDVPGDFRIRLSSVDVADFTRALIAALGRGGRLCPHVHLPLQSADDRLLRAMRRCYRVADYRRLCDNLLAVVPDLAIGADVIAGLPGEDGAAHAATLRFVEEFPFAYLHVFPYSARPGTDAASAPRQVRAPLRDARAAELRRAGAAAKAAYIRRFHGSVRPALVVRGERQEAITDNYIHAVLPGYNGGGNRFVAVRLVVEGGEVKAEVQS